MYKVKKATKEIKGFIDVTMENNKDNAVELAAAWGLFAKKSITESYRIQDDTITFRMKEKTFSEWLDIIKTVRE